MAIGEHPGPERRGEKAARHLVAACLTAAVPAALAGTVDWSEQHEQQMRVGVVHAAGNIAALSLYGLRCCPVTRGWAVRCGWPAWRRSR